MNFCKKKDVAMTPYVVQPDLELEKRLMELRLKAKIAKEDYDKWNATLPKVKDMAKILLSGDIGQIIDITSAYVAPQGMSYYYTYTPESQLQYEINSYATLRYNSENYSRYSIRLVNNLIVRELRLWEIQKQ